MKTNKLIILFLLFITAGGIKAQTQLMTEEEREYIEQNVIMKINDFLSYLPNIAAKSDKSAEERELAYNYIDQALELFIGKGENYEYQDQAGNWRWHDAVTMQTTSRGRANRPQPMKRYLRRLMVLPYQHVEVDTCSAVRINKRLHHIGNGKYVGSAYFIQAFRATRDGKLVIDDVDAKQVTIYVEKQTINTPDGEKVYWLIQLGDIKIKTDW